jgi:EAL domain-containing protein (putative c-di-GMP-specific phosphodiesterase class I)/DNA-binding CsgD family transcriptional regulator
VAEGDAATNDALADWVIGDVVETYQVLTELGISVPLAVNLSTLNLHDLTLPDRLEQRLRAGGMPLRQLCLEITDSAMSKDSRCAVEILSRLQLKGVRLSIDNFGAGYSTLKLLRQLPFTEIKIDRSFVGDAATSQDSRAIVKSIIDLAASMKLGCMAEGVETAETADLLEKLGVRDMQGYLIAEPMPVEAVAAWLEGWTRSGPGVLRDRPTGQVNDATNDPLTKPGPRELSQAPAAVLPAAAVTGVVRLPPRQLEVMRLLSDGCSVKEIAHRLNLGIGTVKVHIALAYSALGAHNRTEAIKRAGPALLSQ